MRRKDIEIMAPVGCMESLHAAIEAGADAIYFGVGVLNMRAKSSVNFTLDDLAEIVSIARAAGVKSYLTVNTVLYDNEMEAMCEVIDRAAAEGVDAIIAADVAAIMYARRVGMEVHISTQCNISNAEAVKFYSQWADVVVLARELSLEQIAHISREIEQNQIVGPRGELVRIEMFAHGALCMSISGKCYLSEHEEGCSANRGACRQICRRKYQIKDLQTGRELAIDGRYILSPKDLCTIDFLDKFIAAGVRVLKIEGRARGGEYVKRVVESYDAALRAMERGEYNQEFAEGLKQKLMTVFNRGFWEGYYAGRPMAEHTSHYGSSATERKVYVGKITNFFKKISVAEILVESASLNEGDSLLFMGETTGVKECRAENIVLHEQVVKQVSKGSYCSMKVDSVLRRGDKLYKMVPADHEDVPKY
ncbi:MAG: U32 family peptidase [Alistipes sp.]|nr:U32 family peptidase [Alistipes sp.]